jgi:hypothetical protein
VKELIKYPPQFKIGFPFNNPPIYDLLPKAREAIEKFKRESRPNLHSARALMTLQPAPVRLRGQPIS